MTNQLGNTTNESDSSSQKTSTDSEYVIIQSLFVLIGSFGFLENIVVVAIILRDRLTMLDFPSNRFVLSLAIADAMFCSITVPLAYALYFGESYFFLGAVTQFVTVTSAGNLFVLTLDRFVSVYNSLRYPALMTCNRATYLVISPWAIAFLLSAVVGISGKAGIQNITYLHSSYYTTLIILTSTLNIYMFKVARKKRRVTIQQQQEQQSVFLAPRNKLLKKEFRLLIRLFFVTLTFFGTCIPMLILLYLYPTIPSRQTRSFQRKIIWCFLAMLLNAVANPFIYSNNNPMFKRYFNNVRSRVFPKHYVGSLNSQCKVSLISLQIHRNDGR